MSLGIYDDAAQLGIADDEILEPAAVDDFYFDGIGRMFVAGANFRLVFWKWQLIDGQRVKVVTRAAVTPAENVTGYARDATAAVAASSAVSTIKRLVS